MSRQRSPGTERASQRRQRRETLHTGRSVSWKPPEAKCAERIKGSHETRSTLVRRHEQPTERGRPRPRGQGTTRRQHETEVDTEAGMLSGVSRKRSIRSNPCWFTEFCKSQCLSHFAAPFIVVRAEASVAESCEVKHHYKSGRSLQNDDRVFYSSMRAPRSWEQGRSKWARRPPLFGSGAR